MASVGKYTVNVDVIVKGLREAQKRINSLQTGFRALSGGGASLVGTFAKLTAGYLSFQGAIRGSTYIFETISSFDTLTATLRTLNGEIKGNSFPKATAEFDRIREIALKTPFTVEKVGQAFAQLKARGVDVSDVESVMTSVGNTSAAFGQDITSFANAVGQAISGENERLKQFGIGAKVNGKKVTFSYKGMTKTVTRDADSISKALLSFGGPKGEGFAGAFAGGAELQAKTLGGAFSRLKDIVQIFVFEFGRSGFRDAMVDIIGDLRSLGDGAEKFAKRFGKKAGEALLKFRDAMKTLPAKFKAAKQAMKEFMEGLPEFMQIENAAEAITRISAALTTMAGLSALPKIITFLTGVGGAVAGMALGEILLLAGGIILALAAVFLIFDDIYTYLQGGVSVTGALIDAWNSADGGALGAIKGLFEEIMDVGQSLYDHVLEPLFSLLSGVGTSVWENMAEPARFWGDVIGLVFETAIRSVTILIKSFRILATAMASIFDKDIKASAITELMSGIDSEAFSIVDAFHDTGARYQSGLAAGKKRKAARAAADAGLPPLNAGSSGLMAGGGTAKGGDSTTNVASTTNATITVTSLDPQAAGVAVKEELVKYNDLTATIATARAKGGNHR